jgi:hypothetical protein
MERWHYRVDTFPEWNGGITVPPAVLVAEQGYVDPFVTERPMLRISAANADQHKVNPGLTALLKTYLMSNLDNEEGHRSSSATRRSGRSSSQLPYLIWQKMWAKIEGVIRSFPRPQEFHSQLEDFDGCNPAS